VKKEANDLEIARQRPIRALETGSPIRFVSAATIQNLSKEGIAASSGETITFQVGRYDAIERDGQADWLLLSSYRN
jgi:hypothetical protein